MILIEHHVMVKVNNISRFFRDEIEIFSNLVVRDEIEICFFYISCFETRSRICFTTSRISRRGRETKQLILEVEREFSMLILARHFEIENSRQCLMPPTSTAVHWLWLCTKLLLWVELFLQSTDDMSRRATAHLSLVCARWLN